MLRLEFPYALFLLLLIPVFLYFRIGRSNFSSLLFSSTQNVNDAQHSLKQRLSFLPTLLRIIVFVLLIIALARPQMGKELVHDTAEGIAIEMVIDRSASMQAPMEFEGEEVTRLDVVKRVFKDFVNGNPDKGLQGRPNDLIGMVAFARYYDTVAPLTLAHGALNDFLDKIKFAIRAEEGGTNIGDAVALACARLQLAEETLARQVNRDANRYEIKSKIIILLTDGDHQGESNRSPMEAATIASDWGIKVYAIGVGTEGEFPITVIQNGRKMSIVVKGVDRKTLTSMADETGGQFFMANDAESLFEIFREIEQLERTEIESVTSYDWRENFEEFIGAALFLLFLEVLLSCTWLRRIP